MTPSAGQAIADSPEPTSDASEAAIDRMIAIIDEMQPYIDDEATAYCRLKAAEGGKGLPYHCGIEGYGPPFFSSTTVPLAAIRLPSW